MKAVIFDLDDTLYPEIEYVQSGFKAVANYLQEKTGRNADNLYLELMEILQQEGRGKIFDILLKRLNAHSPILVKLLVYIYRSHNPQIKLYDDVIETFAVLRSHSIRLGVLTDGMGSVQCKKIAALGLDNMVAAILCTDVVGSDCWKPSPIPFQIALDLLEAKPDEATYVGDNVQKDFAGPNALGMKTIQVKAVRTHADDPEMAQDSVFKPQCVVQRLKDILAILVGEKT